MAVELAKLVFQYWSRKKNLLSSLAVEKVIKIIELFLKGTSVVVQIIHFSTWVISVTRWLIHLFKTYMIFALVSAIKPFIQYLAIYNNTNLSQVGSRLCQLQNYHRQILSHCIWCGITPFVLIATSVTRSGDLLDFGQLFKAFGNNLFGQISHILRHFFKDVKIDHFSSESILGNFYRHLAIFFWSHIRNQPLKLFIKHF